jgi:hypothetical protein
LIVLTLISESVVAEYTVFRKFGRGEERERMNVSGRVERLGCEVEIRDRI